MVEKSISVVYGALVPREKYYGAQIETLVGDWRRVNQNTALYAHDVEQSVLIGIVVLSTQPSKKRRIASLFDRHVVLTKAGLSHFLFVHKTKAYSEWSRFVVFVKSQGNLLALNNSAMHMITTNHNRR